LLKIDFVFIPPADATKRLNKAISFPAWLFKIAGAFVIRDKKVSF
jgi:hypothetical protein